ncbi:hypothetical protein RchiOBHm_Chr1g0332121 [Rosa chinensis]|uniref:Uncharacterized protein n=1 Tax=Rosa chinensis TaxID=74649 RepID=A0A2P6SBQ6_ROSCH|nr:hypothetical protein RchiOBHm_Chr1g0332121 [Rosa chinensis]
MNIFHMFYPESTEKIRNWIKIDPTKIIPCQKENSEYVINQVREPRPYVRYLNGCLFLYLFDSGAMKNVIFAGCLFAGFSHCLFRTMKIKGC